MRDLYDTRHAAAYDERFLTGPDWARAGAEFEVEVLAELLEEPGTRWLDAGCGTGWFLARFLDVERTGIDLSPAMLERAAAANPGVQLVEGSFLDPHPEWDGCWDVVSCMWSAYAYLGDVDAVERLLANLGRWTAPGGRCFLPVCDLTDISGGTQVAYRNDEAWTFGGPLRVVATVWSWTDEELGKEHRHLVAPHIDHLVEVLGRHFAEVEVVHHPPFQPGWGARRALVGRGRRPEPGVGDPVVVTQRVEPYRGPQPEADVPPSSPPEPPVPVADPPVAEGPAAVPPERQRGVWGLWWRLPLPARRTVRRAWKALPQGVRRRVAPG